MSQVVALAVGYGFACMLVVLVVTASAADWGWVPDGAELATGVVSGMLWPITIVVAASYALLVAARAIGRSFACLFRAILTVRVFPGSKPRPVDAPPVAKAKYTR